jgi:hypothetical protein
MNFRSLLKKIPSVLRFSEDYAFVHVSAVGTEGEMNTHILIVGVLPSIIDDTGPT